MDTTESRFADYRERLESLSDIAALVTVHELGIFQALLDGPLEVDTLAQDVGVSAERLEPVLLLAADQGFLHWDGTTIELQPGDHAIFQTESAYWQQLAHGDFARLFRNLSATIDVLRTDRALDAASTGADVDGAHRGRFLQYFHANTHHAAEIASLLSENEISRFADLGCGAGTYSFEILKACPKATGVLVDRPNAESVIARGAKELAFESRVEFSAVDARNGGYGDKFDLILASNLIHCLGMSDNLKLLGEAAKALRPGGRLVIKDYHLGDGTNDRSLKRFAYQLAISSEEGRLYSQAEVTLWLHLIGLELRDTYIVGNSYLILARKPSD